LTRGWSVDRVSQLTGFDPWFVDQMLQLVERRKELRTCEHLSAVPDELLLAAKRDGFSDAHIARILSTDEEAVRTRRARADIRPVYKTVDTCAAEFEAYTPYHYSTYESEDEVTPSDRQKVMVLGSGPNRIGQGVEFDYCCVHAVFSLQEAGYETIMVNCNPETVSTDYDTADRLYFEPLTLEDVLAICEREQPMGVVVQMGGQTPLKLASQLQDAGVPILGTPPEAIDAAEDRGKFGALMRELGIAMPPGGVARSFGEAKDVAEQIGYPALVRPSYVLGGRAMEIVYDERMLEDYLEHAVAASPDQPVLIDRFLEGAIEVDVDAVYDGQELFVGGVLEHIEEAGVHSGDSACTLPPITLGRSQIRQIRDFTEGIARGLGVRGLINVQYALKDDVVYCIEANPRASRTVPFVSKTTGVALAKVATRVMVGDKLADLRAEGLLPEKDVVDGPRIQHIAVKEAVLPFDRFPGVDSLLGPEMRSTGEVMGIDRDFGYAFAKSQAGTGSMILPTRGTVFVSVSNRDKRSIVFPVKRLVDLGFDIVATEGTADVLSRSGVPGVGVLGKVSEGSRAILDLLREGDIDLVLNTPFGVGTRGDGYDIRQAAVTNGVPCITTLAGILAAIHGIESLRSGPLTVTSLQEYQAAARQLRESEVGA
ncbi:MAG: carbamoyl-phosphate synthase large subunit, partial [Actinobacteria bacterium]|nr:carbamoyl-phosphate synthase large subunit [Actinomycetota bacterium]